MTREKLRVVALGGSLAAAMLTGLSACSSAPAMDPTAGYPITMNDPRPVPSRLYAILEAPSNLGLRRPGPGREPGVRRLPEALEAAGFSRRIGASRAGRVEPPAYRGEIDPETGIREAPAIRDYSLRLAEAVGRVLDERRFPVVLGGDCSILLGNMLALHRRGRYGLIFLDAHTDLATPELSGTKAAAGMDLALALGIGPALLSRLDPQAPLVRAEDVAMLGLRGLNPEWSQRITETGVVFHDLASLRRQGIAATVRTEFARLERQGVEGFWIHLDADVLDDAVMPAVDSRQPGGLSLGELTAALRELLRSPRAAGLHIGIYDPDLDPTGEHGRALTDALVAGLNGG
jgi:arginase